MRKLTKNTLKQRKAGTLSWRVCQYFCDETDRFIRSTRTAIKCYSCEVIVKIAASFQRHVNQKSR